MGYRIRLLDADNGTEDYSEHITSNVAPMWREAGIDFRDWQDKTAGNMEPFLAAALREMIAYPDAYQAMNPANKYGSYYGCLRFMANLLDECRRRPNHIIDLDY
jgi:hypothetical protein